MTRLDSMTKEASLYHMFLFSPGWDFAGGGFNNT